MFTGDYIKKICKINTNRAGIADVNINQAHPKHCRNGMLCEWAHFSERYSCNNYLPKLHH